MTDLQNFITNGFVLKKGLFSNKEIDKLNQYIAIRQDKEESARETTTSTGKLTMTMWNHPSEDLFGKIQVMVDLIGIKIMVIGITMLVFIQIWHHVL